MSGPAAQPAAKPPSRTTVVIMSHNYGRYLGLAIDSAFAQSRPPARVVVVDDASTDDTAEVIRPYLDRVEFHRVEFRSQQRTRNFGLARATTEYALFLDADDHMAVEMIERLEDALDANPEARLAYCDKTVFGDEAAMRRLNLAPQWRARPFSVEALHFKNFIMATSLLRRQCIDAFDERVVRLTDWDTWLGLLQDDAHAVYVPEPLLHYRVHGENVSIRRREMVERLKILVKHGLLPLEQPSSTTPQPLGPGAKVAVLTVNSEHAALPGWEALAQRLGWSVRALVGVPAASGADATALGGPVARGRQVVLQTAPASDAEDLMRRFAGVVSDPRLDAIVLAPDLDLLTAALPGRPSDGAAVRCDLDVERIVGSRSLADLGLLALTPAAVRTLLYLPPATRPGVAEQLKQVATDFISRHITWRLRRLSAATRPPAH